MDKSILFSNSARVNCWGGVEKWVLTAATALMKKGYTVYLICRKGSVIEKKAINLNIKTFNTNYINSLDLVSVNDIYRTIRKHRIDLIICSTNLDIKLAGMAGKLAHIPVVSRQGLALVTDRFKYKILIKYFTTSILTNTITIKQQYETYKWFPKNHIQVIYNGTEIPSRQIQSATMEIPSKPSGAKLILGAGRLNPQKGFNYLIDTARYAQENKKNWYFMILGNGHLQGELQAQINRYQLKNIILQGFCENVRDYYAAADLFVLSSLSEGTPNVVLEAMANKLPVVATNVNGVAEIIDNGWNGITVPAADPEALYQAIEKVIDTPERLESLAQNGFKTVSEKFSIQQFSEKFSEYIHETLALYEKHHHKNS